MWALQTLLLLFCDIKAVIRLRAHTTYLIAQTGHSHDAVVSSECCEGVEITSDIKKGMTSKRLADFKVQVAPANMPEIASLRADVEEFASQFPTIGYVKEDMRYPSQSKNVKWALPWVLEFWARWVLGIGLLGSVGNGYWGFKLAPIPIDWGLYRLDIHCLFS